ncbi:uncharacterized protein TM35_000053760 [Trypanosoma theileri]|uniref:WW domain-containing protein n=1 Tax=Trypanosoma theileri TaxID=67003 RepID=A0A1X0P5S6_9TRYP|nr:uncharacterized protein TM35_000053760 [Trypanosoma theileri]ORC91780.1 hypothetical protein TM35_000053760 [Trypanosoma theileri]
MESKFSAICNDRRVVTPGQNQELVNSTEDWNTSSVLIDRFYLLQLHGKNIDTHIAELKKECDQITSYKLGHSSEKNKLSTHIIVDSGVCEKSPVPVLGELPCVSFSPYSQVHIKRRNSSLPINGGSPGAKDVQFQDPCWGVCNSTTKRYTNSRERHSSSPQLIIEVVDSYETESKVESQFRSVPNVNEMNSVGDESAVCQSKLLSSLKDAVTTDISIPPSSLLPPPLSALQSLPSGGNRISDERQEHISFLLDQIQQINAPPQSASPVADIFQRIRYKFGALTNATDTVSTLGDSRIQSIKTTEAKNELKKQTSLPLSAETFVNSGEETSSSYVLSHLNHTPVAPLSKKLPPPPPSLPRPPPPPPPPPLPPSSSSAKKVPSLAVEVTSDNSFGVCSLTSSPVVDYDKKVQEALQSGEWKETKDKKGRVYYYNPKEKKTCWNLAKEFRRLAGESGS